MSRWTVTLDGVEYRPGRRFRVRRGSCYLSGMRQVNDNHVAHYAAWRHALNEGEVIVCTGFGVGYGGGFGVGWTNSAVQAQRVEHVEFRPGCGDLSWNFRPAPGWLDALDESVQNSELERNK